MPDSVVGVIPQPLSVEALFRSQVPQEMREEVVRIIRDAYRAAPDLARGMYAPDQAREVAPRLRRADLESRLLGLEKFSGVKAESLKSSGSSYFVQLQVGDLILITARALDPDKMIPKAAYRTQIALRSAQGNLFGEEPVSPDARYYAVILHGSARGQVDPTFIVVRFPTSDHENYLDVRIDLKDEYAYLFEDQIELPSSATRIEEILDTQTLTVRRDIAVEKSDTA